MEARFAFEASLLYTAFQASQGLHTETPSQKITQVTKQIKRNETSTEVQPNYMNMREREYKLHNGTEADMSMGQSTGLDGLGL